MDASQFCELNGAPAMGGMAESAMSATLAELAALDMHDLRVAWRKRFRQPPPDLPRFLLWRMFAYRVQASAFGDLDRASVRYLQGIARAKPTRGAGSVPPVPDPNKGRLKVGAELVREHDGVLHRVRVVDGGFAWNGATYASLSEVARAITGTRWNGPRFFGLRDRAKADRAGKGASS